MNTANFSVGCLGLGSDFIPGVETCPEPFAGHGPWAPAQGGVNKIDTEWGRIKAWLISPANDLTNQGG